MNSPPPVVARVNQVLREIDRYLHLLKTENDRLRSAGERKADSDD